MTIFRDTCVKEFLMCSVGVVLEIDRRTETLQLIRDKTPIYVQSNTESRHAVTFAVERQEILHIVMGCACGAYG